MTLTRKDLGATALTALVVLTFAAAHQGWDVWLVGDSYRWATAVILVLGIATCALGSPERGGSARLLSALGVLALALGAIALVTGSLTALSFLVLAIVALWALSTFRHVRHPQRTPVRA